MQICQSLIGGQLVASALPAIDKIYPATGETIAKIEDINDRQFLPVGIVSHNF